jgi:hypothetical protein
MSMGAIKVDRSVRERAESFLSTNPILWFKQDEDIASNDLRPWNCHFFKESLGSSYDREIT